jgi:hypothetical protein
MPYRGIAFDVTMEGKMPSGVNWNKNLTWHRQSHPALRMN